MAAATGHAVKTYQIVQIGAHNGLDEYSTRVAEHGLRGLFVEPNPILFDELKQRYQSAENIEFANVALGAEAGTLDFFYFEDTSGMPDWADQTSSLSRQHVLQVAEANGYLERAMVQIKSTPVAVLTFTDLIKSYDIEAVELLQIDAEGRDIEIILSIDFEKIQIGEIIFEHKHADGFLNQGAGYSKAIRHLHDHGFVTEMLDRENTRGIKQ